jgi:hypothetical protein
MGVAMPHCIVVICSELAFMDEAIGALGSAGYDVVAFTDPIVAIDALKVLPSVDLLISGASFGPNKPQGVSVGRMAKHRRPGIKVLYTAQAEFAGYLRDVGEVLPANVAMPDLLNAVGRLLRTIH